ncbi:MAG: hypothetical protein QM662_15730 [Gordonia sp. (in: high G+C Gram-positive bacteria)]
MRLWSELPEKLRVDLDARWNEPHRHHHTARHRDEMLAALEVLADAGEPFAERPVVLAVWFHDAIYEVFGTDNEGRSAELAATLLGAGDPDVDEVVRLVELTRTHEVAPGDRNGAALSDADLWVLGTSPRRYREYTEAVRAEYRRIPGPLYRRGRAKILRELLSHEHLYVTPTARARWEASARANLEAEIARLS